jgi:O-antigen/teichoic acid export membrane protein
MKNAPNRDGLPLLARNTVLNFAGYGVPLIVAAFSIPLIIKGIGTDRFGILTLAWVIIGYLSLLDLGIGRALTKVVSEKIGKGQLQDIPSTICTALSAMLLLSICIGTVFGFSTHYIAHELLEVPLKLKQETEDALLILSVFIPVIVISVGFRGVLEAHQRFDLVNSIRIPLGIFSFIAPLGVIPFSVKLSAIIGVLIAGRLAAFLVQLYFCCKVEKNILRDFRINPKIFGELIRFGGWMTASNILGPLLMYLDRFIIGALISISAVAYYATPSEVITKLVLIPLAIMSVLFPAISASYDIDRRRSAFLLESGLKYIYVITFPIILTLVCFAPEGLKYWLDDSFRIQSLRVAQLLSAGMLFICLGRIPYGFIQGAGRPEITGMLHIFEFPVYLIFVFSAIKIWGINGVAVAWALRAFFDAVCLFFFAQRLLGADRLKIRKKIILILAAVGIMAALAIVESLPYRIAGFMLVISGFLLMTIRYFLSDQEKSFLRSIFTQLSHPFHS